MFHIKSSHYLRARSDEVNSISISKSNRKMCSPSLLSSVYFLQGDNKCNCILNIDICPIHKLFKFLWNHNENNNVTKLYIVFKHIMPQENSQINITLTMERAFYLECNGQTQNQKCIVQSYWTNLCSWLPQGFFWRKKKLPFTVSSFNNSIIFSAHAITNVKNQPFFKYCPSRRTLGWSLSLFFSKGKGS